MDISKTELEVMQAIWQGSPVTSNEIVARLNQQRQWHDKTVKTLLGRLVKKGALEFTKNGRQYLYSPCVSETDYQAKESQSLVSRLFNGRISPLVAGFAQREQLSEQDIAELKQLIADWEQESD